MDNMGQKSQYQQHKGYSPTFVQYYVQIPAALSPYLN